LGLGFILQDFAFNVWMWLLLIPRHNGYGAAASFNWNGSRTEHMGFEDWL